MNPDSLLQGEEISQNEADVAVPAVAEPQHIPPAVQPVPIGLSAVLDVKDGEGRITGHYQWATHKDGKQDSLVVVNVVKSHDGVEQVLYKTYSESAIAKKVTEDAAGIAEVKENMATVKIGEAYRLHDGSVSNYSISDLLEFQSIGFVLVLFVLAGLWALISFVSYIVKILGLGQPAAGAGLKPATAAAASAKTIHPGMSDEKFVAIISAAAAHALGGQPVSVVKFKPLNTMDWTWAVQGRVSLHTHKV